MPYPYETPHAAAAVRFLHTIRLPDEERFIVPPWGFEEAPLTITGFDINLGYTIGRGAKSAGPLTPEGVQATRNLQIGEVTVLYMYPYLQDQFDRCRLPFNYFSDEGKALIAPVLARYPVPTAAQITFI